MVWVEIIPFGNQFPLRLLRRESKSSRGDGSNRCFQQVPINDRDAEGKAVADGNA